jgi:hypothetical protein
MKLAPPIDDDSNCGHAQVKLAPLMMLQVVSRDYHVITSNNVVVCLKTNAQVTITHI